MGQIFAWHLTPNPEAPWVSIQCVCCKKGLSEKSGARSPVKISFFWVPAAYTIGPFSDWPICHSLFLVHPSDPSFCQELWRKWNKARNIPCASERSSSSILYFPQQKLGLRWIKGIWWLYVPLYRQCMIMIDNVVKPTINHPQDGHKWLVKKHPHMVGLWHWVYIIGSQSLGPNLRKPPTWILDAFFASAWLSVGVSLMKPQLAVWENWENPNVFACKKPILAGKFLVKPR